uniref:Small vasohibin-binding protein n=1 Tax=Ficedula albicollis TaxID=59894 RepID=A0A803VSV8_FICAL
GDGPLRGLRNEPAARPPLPSALSRSQIYALNRVMTELEQQQFDSFCKQMQGSGE